MIERKIQDIVETVASGEPMDYATLNFDDPKVRQNYRLIQSIALEHIANRECIFCFNKSNENGMGELCNLERIGYAHSPCIDAFYQTGFTFKLIGFIPQLNDYSWEIV